MNKRKGVSLIVLVITIIVMIILSGVVILSLSKNNPIGKANEAKVLNAIATIKEEISLEQTNNLVTGAKLTMETLVKDGRAKRTVIEKDGVYNLNYYLTKNAFQGMSGLGNGNPREGKDLFLIDEQFNIKYIASNKKEYGSNVGTTVIEDETEIKFASKEFSKYVSEKAGIAEDELKFKWMKNQTELKIIENNEINNLEDLVFFPNLKNLEINKCNNITSLNGVEYCKKIEKVDVLYGPESIDYSALTNCESLKRFTRRFGNDSDAIIDALKTCPNLEGIFLGELNITSMARMKELPKSLKYLNLNGNYAISKIEEIEKMDDLLGLYLAGNKIVDISPLKENKNLREIDLTNNQVVDISALGKLKNLVIVNLENNQIPDITPLASNEGLKKINLKGNKALDANRDNYTGDKLKAIEKLDAMIENGCKIELEPDKMGLFETYKDSITDLNFSNKGLTNLEIVKGMTNLKKLNLDVNNITLADQESKDILSSLTNLEHLVISRNPLVDISPINNLTKLKILYIRTIPDVSKHPNLSLSKIQNVISNLYDFRVSPDLFETIKDCDVDKITKLNLIECANETFPDLSKFTKLTNLKINYSGGIKNWDSIGKITSLQRLDLLGNKFHDKKVQIDLSKLTNLNYLDLRSNGLWTEDLKMLEGLKNNKNLHIRLEGNRITDAGTLLQLDPSCKIELKDNINLTEDAKTKLKKRFGNKVSF